VNNNPLNAIDPTGLAPWNGIVDFFSGDGCGPHLGDAIGTLGDALGQLASLAWEYGDEIAFVAMLVGSASSGGTLALIWYGGFALAGAKTAESCIGGDRLACALGVTSLGLSGSGAALEITGRSTAAAGAARSSASRWHPIQLWVGPRLERLGTAIYGFGTQVGRLGDLGSAASVAWKHL
jgi:hypothetical protein